VKNTLTSLTRPCTMCLHAYLARRHALCPPCFCLAHRLRLCWQGEISAALHHFAIVVGLHGKASARWQMQSQGIGAGYIRPQPDAQW
jgi:hypothetical protein